MTNGRWGRQLDLIQLGGEACHRMWRPSLGRAVQRAFADLLRVAGRPGENGPGTMDRTQQLERRLRELEEKTLLTRAVIEAAVDGIVMIDDRGVIQTFNPSAERIFGYKASEAIGQNVRLLMPEPEASQHDEHLRRYLQTGQARIIGFGREVRGRRKDGSVFPMQLGVSELRVGSQRSFVGMIHDITPLKQAEEALRSERDRAESANRVKSQFLANMSHEIRTPMNGILGMSMLLLDTRLDVEQREFVESVRSSAESLLAIINDILDFSKVEAGKFELESRPFESARHDDRNPEAVRTAHASEKTTVPRRAGSRRAHAADGRSVAVAAGVGQSAG